MWVMPCHSTPQDILICCAVRMGRNVLWMPGTHPCRHQRRRERRGVGNCKPKAPQRGDTRCEAFSARGSGRKKSGGTIIGPAQENPEPPAIGKVSASPWTSWALRAVRTKPRLPGAVPIWLLLYCGEWLINWCPRCSDRLSGPTSVEHEEGRKLYTIRYHLVDDPTQFLRGDHAPGNPVRRHGGWPRHQRPFRHLIG